jgi:hypothetical protein
MEKCAVLDVSVQVPGLGKLGRLDVSVQGPALLCSLSWLCIELKICITAESQSTFSESQSN